MGIFDDNMTTKSNNIKSTNSGGGGIFSNSPAFSQGNTQRPVVQPKKELSTYQKFDQHMGGFLPWGTKPIDLSEISGSDVLNFGKNVGKDLINLPLKFNDAVAEGVTFGGSEKLFDFLARKTGEDAVKAREEEKRNFQSKSFVGDVTEGVGELAGSLIPISKLDKGAGLILKKFGQKPATTFGGKVGQAMKRDAIAGAGYGAIDETIDGGDFGDIIGSALTDAVLFGAMGGVLKGTTEWKSLKKPPAPDSIPLNSPESFNQKISWEKTPEKTTWGEWGNNILTGFVDRFRPAEQLEHSIVDGARQNIDLLNKRGKSIPSYLTDYLKDIGKDGLHSADKSFYKQLRLFSGVPEKINNFIENNLKPIIQDVEKAG